MKLSDISVQSYSVALKIDSITDYMATDRFLFISRGALLYQFDPSGKLIRTFTYSNKKFTGFLCDTKNNKLVLIYSDGITVWNLDGIFLKKVLLPESSFGPSDVIGFKQNNIWILRHIKQVEKVCYQICRMNVENERIETILEHVFPAPKEREVSIGYKAWYSSVGGKSYIGFHDNVFYEIDGKNVRPAVKYNILHYKEGISDRIFHEKRFAGRYFNIRYGSFGNSIVLWYDIKEKRTWQVQQHYRSGGIVDDIFHTGTCDNYWIHDEYLIFRKTGHNLPKTMNVGKDQNAFFIVKLKQ